MHVATTENFSEAHTSSASTRAELEVSRPVTGSPALAFCMLLVIAYEKQLTCILLPRFCNECAEDVRVWM
jgi:hypothetical protein